MAAEPLGAGPLAQAARSRQPGDSLRAACRKLEAIRQREALAGWADAVLTRGKAAAAKWARPELAEACQRAGQGEQPLRALEVQWRVQGAGAVRA